MLAKIVVGVDGHDGGRDALALGGVLAELCIAPLVAVRVHAPLAPNGPFAHADALLHRDVELELSTDLAQAGVSAAPRVVADRSAASALHRVAVEEEADLIVVGSTRHGPPDASSRAM